MGEIIKKQLEIEKTYEVVRNSVVNAQKYVYTSVNHAMVQAYWEIGEQIYKACGENDRAEYGKGLIAYISEKLTKEFGRGFDERNIRRMRQFYCAYPIRDSLRPELSWTHYRTLLRNISYICQPRKSLKRN